MPCHPRYLVILVPVLILLPGCLAKTDDLGRVRVLYLGNTVLSSIMSADPTVQVYPVPAYLFGMKEEDVHRFLRTYMPRTYAGLVDSSDVIYVGDSGVRSYTPAWLGWMADGVRTASADEQLSEARWLFIRKDLDACAGLMDRAFATLAEAEALAIKAKDAAFLWIYIIEWLAVTCTFMIAGAIVWELMVRRAVLREAATTRAVHSA